MINLTHDIFLIALLLVVCGLLWYRGFLLKRRLRYWRDQALMHNAVNRKSKYEHHTTRAPWIRK
tara:strand:+ start:7084 stop:7275 length:192 start_codon:yes stop_codon:yes gene_type:complete